jgi:glycosyltransferase involved in cell wall biosynthesis
MGNHFSIVHIITGLTTGGAEMMLYQMLTKSDRERFSPIVISLIDRGALGDRIEALGIPVYTIGIKPGMPPTPAAMWRLVKIMRQLKPDLIQSWMYHGNLVAQFSSFFYVQEIPIFWSIHSTVYTLDSEKIMTKGVIKLGDLFSQFPKQIIYVSKISKSQHEALGYCQENGCVIPNGVDHSRYIPSREARLSVRGELGLPEQSFLIGLICRYHPMKDHANFLQAASLLLKDRPDIHFMLVGTEVDRDNRVLTHLIENLGIANQTHLLGERTDIPRLTAALDIASSSSAYGEAFSLAVAEAMACGLPCVVTDVGDSGWIVSNTGMVVSPRDSLALANAWKELIDLNDESREALGKAARMRIIENFTLDAVVAQYQALYENYLIKNVSKR